jgi:hypothetical protein
MLTMRAGGRPGQHGSTAALQHGVFIFLKI